MKRKILIITFVLGVVGLLSLEYDVKTFAQKQIIAVNNSNYHLVEQEDYTQISTDAGMVRELVGSPTLPYFTFQVSCPHHFTPDVELNIIETKKIKLAKPVEPFPHIYKKDDFYDYAYEIDTQAYQMSRETIEVNSDLSFRRINFSEIVFNPFKYNHENQSLEIITKAEIIINLPYSEQKYTNLDQFEKKFISNLISPSSYYLRESTRSSVNFSDFSFANHWYKIEIEQDGIYSFDYNDLQALLPVDDINPQTFRIFATGGDKLSEIDFDDGDEFKEIPLLIEGESDGSFDSGDKIIFYARDRNDYDNLTKFSDKMSINPYSDQGVYWLTFDAQIASSPLRISSETISPGTINRGNNPQNSRYEREFYKRLQTNLFWYSNFLTGSSTSTYSFNLDLSDIDKLDNNGNGLVKVALIEEFTESSAISNSHRVSISLNNADIANNINWYGYNYKIIEASADNLTNGDNSIGIKIHRTKEDNLYLDYIEIHYLKKNIKYSKQQLGLNVRDEDLNQAVTYSVTGNFSSATKVFTTNNIYEVKNIPYQINDAELNFTALIPDLQSNQEDYFVDKIYVTDNDYLKANITEVNPLDIISIARNKESIIVYPQDFESQAQRLKNIYESAYNSTTAIVKMTDIFNQFSGGMDDPTALRNFFRHLYSINSNQNLKYVTLLGIGTYDWKNYNVQSVEKNKMIIHQKGNANPTNSVTSDDYFAYLTQTIRPELAIGRYPVKTASELDMMIDKFEIYSNKDFTIDWWRNTGLLVADDLKNGTSTNETAHTTQLETASRNLPPSLINVRIYAYQYEADEFGKKPNTRKDFIKAINDGALFTYYSGHGSYDQLGTEAYFRRGLDTSQLTNDNKRTFFISAACDASQFDSPNFDCLSTDLLKYDAGGAIASYGATRLCYIPNNNIMVGNLLYFSMDNREDIGTAIMLTKGREISHTNNITNQSKYILFGDPHLKINPPASRSNINFVDGQNSFKARETVRFTGDLSNPNVSVSQVLAFQSDSYIPLANNEILVPGKYIFNGSVSVNNGLYNSAFVVPDDIIDGDLGKILVFGYDESTKSELLDFYYPVAFAGQLYTGENESAPEISIWLESYDFRDGDRVSRNPKLFSHLSDKEGINVAGGSGHQILLMIDDDFNSFDITPYFSYDIDSYTQGKIEYQISNLEPGQHTLKILAFDNLNKPAVQAISFQVSENSQLSLTDILPYPNPMPKSGGDFTFKINQNTQVTLDIYTITGKKVNSLQTLATNGFNTIRWNGRDKNGDKLANNTYFYVIKAKADGLTVSAREKFIIFD